MNQGLHLMISKKLVDVEFGQNGILYKASPYSGAFLKHFETHYMIQLIEVSKLLSERFNEYPDNKLKEFMMSNIDRWGGEFTKEAFVREGF
ncbi:hypothetical protein B9T62_23035 [Paenibacillus donghaensis]|uniref:Uncharacterized protein n=2 Tax=Paenibacillus donghaensis TaxID=414771 RepID=A0A2Z2K9R3_9BACL|nr:hypothetical protein B9T62_23035 [Paenibacillus donghaensis]